MIFRHAIPQKGCERPSDTESGFAGGRCFPFVRFHAPNARDASKLENLRGRRGGEEWRIATATHAQGEFGAGRADFADQLCMLPRGVLHAFADLVYHPLRRSGFGGATRSCRVRMWRSMKKQRKFQGRAKELQVDGGVLRVR